jgi:hypothetical protein
VHQFALEDGEFIAIRGRRRHSPPPISSIDCPHGS